MRHLIVVLAVVSALLAFAVSCSRESPTAIRAYELTGSQEERVGKVTKTLGELELLPGEILDTHLVEERIGDGLFGPSDSRVFRLIQVRSADIASWERLFTPLAEPARYAAPASPRDWWVSQDEFQHLRFYEPGPLATSAHGWIGVSPESGRIFVYSFSM
jgi:hypothetical protein